MDAETVETFGDVLRAIADASRVKPGGSWFMHQAAGLGHDYSHTTFGRYLNGTAKGGPSDGLIKVTAEIAESHGIAAQRVYDAAKRPMPTGEFAKRLPLGTDQLPAKVQNALEELLKALVDADEDGVGDATVTPIGNAPSAPQQQRRRAALKGTPEEGKGGDE